MNGEWITLEVSDGTEMRAWVEHPEPAEATETWPGILVLQDAQGLGSHIREVAARFAAQGYTALTPELFHRTGAGFEGGPADIQQALDHIRAMTVDGQATEHFLQAMQVS